MRLVQLQQLLPPAATMVCGAHAETRGRTRVVEWKWRQAAMRSADLRKIAIFLPEFASGGAERQSIGMVPALRARGFEVSFVVQSARGPLRSHVPGGTAVAELGTRSSLKAIRPLAAFLRSARPEILVANMAHPNIVALAAAAMTRSRTKIVTVQHNHLSNQVRSEARLSYRVVPLAYRLLLRRADAVVGVSNGVADDLAKRAGLARSRVTVIHNPVVSDDLQSRIADGAPHPWLLDGRVPVIVAMGRLVPMKDFATALDALAIARRTRPVRLLVLGEGPLLVHLRERAHQLGIEDDVCFCGFVPNPYPTLARASLLMLSSRYEGFGNVIAEALACGVPVVSTDCESGPSEILMDGAFGRLVPVGDAAALADAVLRTLDAPVDRPRLVARGREFSIDAAADRYASLFARLLA